MSPIRALLLVAGALALDRVVPHGHGVLFGWGIAAPILGGLLSTIIGGNQARSQQAQAQQAASQDTQQAFQQQTAYIQQQEAALRNALAGLVGQGNPYLQAGRFLNAPTPYAMPGGGGQVFGGGSGVPNVLSPHELQGLYGPASSQVNPLQPPSGPQGGLPLRLPTPAPPSQPLQGGGHTRSLLSAPQGATNPLVRNPMLMEAL